MTKKELKKKINKLNIFGSGKSLKQVLYNLVDGVGGGNNDTSNMVVHSIKQIGPSSFEPVENFDYSSFVDIVNDIKNAHKHVLYVDLSNQSYDVLYVTQVIRNGNVVQFVFGNTSYGENGHVITIDTNTKEFIEM